MISQFVDPPAALKHTGDILRVLLQAESKRRGSRRRCCKIKVLEAWKAQGKQQVVYEINKLAAVMHTSIFADGALGAKNARDCSHKQYFDLGMERKNGDRSGQKSEKSKSNDKQCSYRSRLGVKKVKFLIENA